MMKNTVKKLHLVLFSLILLITGMNYSSKAGNVSASGEWQYVIYRGDTKGVGGNMTNPSCPFYIGYFKLDYKKFEKDGKGNYNFNGIDYVVAHKDSPNTLWGVGKESYEIKGSYTPMDTNEYCSAPLTGIQEEKAPLRMQKISADGRDLQWYTDFSGGTNRASAVWKVKAKHDGENKITGVLRAYVCEGDSTTNCSLLNTAKFEAKRIKSISEASNKPLFANAYGTSPLTTFMRWVMSFTKPKPILKGESPNSDLEQAGDLSSKYLRSSISAVFPASASLPAKAASNIGNQICRQYGGQGSNPCKVCRNVNCAQGQQPTGPEERVCCFGNCNGSSLCKTNCVDLWTCTTGCLPRGSDRCI